MRTQFTHCIDVGPTDPRAGRHPGAEDRRRHRAGADGRHQLRPTRSTTRRRPSGTPSQYFEMYGSRAIYKDGWWACAAARQAAVGLLARDAAAVRARRGLGPRPGRRGSSTTCPTTSRQAHDLAAEHPEKLTELKELFWQEAERNRVLPLLGGISVFFGILPPMPTITRFSFAGDVQNIQTTDDPAHLSAARTPSRPT